LFFNFLFDILCSNNKFVFNIANIGSNMKKISFYLPVIMVGALFLEDASAGASLPSFLGGSKEETSTSTAPTETKSESTAAEETSTTSETPTAENSGATVATNEVPPAETTTTAAETPVAIHDTPGEPSSTATEKAKEETATQELARDEIKEKPTESVLEEGTPQSDEKLAEEVKKAEAAAE
jgi:hypothetical protein